MLFFMLMHLFMQLCVVVSFRLSRSVVDEQVSIKAQKIEPWTGLKNILSK
jgi:hypothetical protein